MQYAPVRARGALATAGVPDSEFKSAVREGPVALSKPCAATDLRRHQLFTPTPPSIRADEIDASGVGRLSRTIAPKAREVQRWLRANWSRSWDALPRQRSAEQRHFPLNNTATPVQHPLVDSLVDRMLSATTDGDSFPAARCQHRRGHRLHPLLRGTRGFEDLARSVQTLPDRERLVVSLYYVEHLTMKDIAAVLQVSETRVSQLHAQAVKRLRRALLREAA